MTLALVAPPSPLWFFARSAGFVSLVLLTVSVCLGILLTMRLRSRGWPLFLSDSLHGFTALVFFVFLTLHIVTVLLDPFTRFGLGDVLVPFASDYRRVWLGLGVVAFELSLALGLSVYIRRFIGYAAWRVLHYATYAILPMALVHGLATGSDSRSPWGIAIYGVCATAVVAVTVVRLVGSRARVRGPLAAAGALGLVVFGSWAVSGPLHPGWAVAAGTPQRSAANGANPAAAASSSPPLAALLQPFADRVQGTVDGGTPTDIQASGTASGQVDLGWKLDTAAGTLAITAADGTSICVARIDGSSGQGIVASCSPPRAQGSLMFILRLRQRGISLGGVLRVQPGDAGSQGPAPSPSPAVSGLPAI